MELEYLPDELVMIVIDYIGLEKKYLKILPGTTKIIRKCLSVSKIYGFEMMTMHDDVVVFREVIEEIMKSNRSQRYMQLHFHWMRQLCITHDAVNIFIKIQNNVGRSYFPDRSINGKLMGKIISNRSKKILKYLFEKENWWEVPSYLHEWHHKASNNLEIFKIIDDHHSFKRCIEEQPCTWFRHRGHSLNTCEKRHMTDLFSYYSDFLDKMMDRGRFDVADYFYKRYHGELVKVNVNEKK